MGLWFVCIKIPQPVHYCDPFCSFPRKSAIIGRMTAVVDDDRPALEHSSRQTGAVEDIFAAWRAKLVCCPFSQSCSFGGAATAHVVGPSCAAWSGRRASADVTRTPHLPHRPCAAARLLQHAMMRRSRRSVVACMLAAAAASTSAISAAATAGAVSGSSAGAASSSSSDVHGVAMPYGSFSGYFSNDELDAYIDSLAAQDPDIFTPAVVIGQSVEGRDIRAFCAGRCARTAAAAGDGGGAGDSADAAPQVFYNALIHGREPMSMAALVYFTE
jgi:hypothetical protein